MNPAEKRQAAFVVAAGSAFAGGEWKVERQGAFIGGGTKENHY